MKTILSLVSFAAASFVVTSPLSAQTAAAPLPPGDNAPLTAPVSPEAKEKAEDAVLMQQIESSQDSGKGPGHPKNAWAPKGGGGAIAGVAPAGVPYRLQNVITRQAGSRPLLVRTSEPEPKAQAALEEDLSVMAHLLDKALEELPGGQKRAVTAMGIDVFFTPLSTPMRGMYLDNYGALFFLNVSFPVVAPPEKHQDEKPATDSAWEDARQELYGQRLQANAPGEPAEEFSQEKVDKLKEILLGALKNATNIRDLKPDEFVTLWVSGGVSGAGGRFRAIKHKGNLDRNTMPADQEPLLVRPDNVDAIEVGPRHVVRRTILTIRVSKAEIDTYAKGKTSAEDFAKRARITTYTDDAPGGADGLMIGNYNGRPRF
jgi:hypothetical protein